MPKICVPFSTIYRCLMWILIDVKQHEQTAGCKMSMLQLDLFPSPTLPTQHSINHSFIIVHKIVTT